LRDPAIPFTMMATMIKGGPWSHEELSFKEDLSLMNISRQKIVKPDWPVREILKGIMKGKEAVVKLSCEGPTLSPFSIACAQISDSFYVCHSENCSTGGAMSTS